MADYDQAALEAIDSAEAALAFMQWFQAFARRATDDARAWLEEHEYDLRVLLDPLGHALDRVERRFESPSVDGSEWIEGCRVRSCLQWLADLSDDGDWWIEELDTDDLDAALRVRGETEGALTAIPAGMPPSHWWWWLPGDPPAE